MSAIEYAAASLSFPWQGNESSRDLDAAEGLTLARDILAPEDFPPFDRSTRDGYALISEDSYGASQSNPAFLTIRGEVPMAAVPSFSLSEGECALIHTGGVLPAGADAVIMLENVERTGNWLEIRKAVQKGENIVFRGEEFSAGAILLPKGVQVDFKSSGVLAAAGISKAPVQHVKVGILSTGDEIVPCETRSLNPGQFRDANANILSSLLRRHGYEPVYLGIVEDSKVSLEKALYRAMEECDVVLLSGGSSVSTRDHCSTILECLEAPGLLVRGILMSPGKPTLIAGIKEKQKLVMGLPGHPFSCFLAAYTVFLPLAHAMNTGAIVSPWRSVVLPVSESVFGHSGIEEFLPCALRDGKAVPLPVKSSFAKALGQADGILRLSSSRETVRPGEEVEVWLW
jgi:molybdopterin molybdotransferase